MPYLNKGCRPAFNNGLGGDSNSGPVLAPSVYLSPTLIMASNRATPILRQMKYTSVQVPTYDFLEVTISGKGPMPDLNNGPGTDISDRSKQIRLCTGLCAPA